MVNRTLAYYAAKAEEFASGTVAVDFRTTQDRFLRYVVAGGYILDLGCGSGRDSRYFAEQGYRVAPVDGCEALCHLAEEYTGLPVRRLLFSQLEAVEAFDGVWACASILHVPRAELVDVLGRIKRALKAGGYGYISFKYGHFEGLRNGRYFTDMTEASLEELLRAVPGLRTVELWISGDVREGRAEEKWLNVIVKKG